LRGTTIADCLLALSREIRALDRLLGQIAALNGDEDGTLPHTLARNLAHLARRADEVALMALQSFDGETRGLLGLPTQPPSSAHRN
jgi:hypothetical protein